MDKEMREDGVGVARPWKPPPYPATPTEREALAKRQAVLGVKASDVWRLACPCNCGAGTIAECIVETCAKVQARAAGVTGGHAPCAETYAGCAPDCHAGNRCTPGVTGPDGSQS